MRRIKFLLKIIAFSLAVILFLQMFPFSIVSTAINNADVVERSMSEGSLEYSSKVIGEVESLRDEYTKHFRCDDGSFVAAIYNEPVHYQENGEWKEIDNTLVANNNYGDTARVASINNAKYTISETSTPITFPKDINNGRITITNGNNIISFGPKNGISNNTSVATISAPEELDSSTITNLQTNEEIQNIKENKTELAVATKNSAITYDNVFENASIEYEVSSSIIKESIIISEKSDSYRYEFAIDFGSYFPVLDNLSGGIYIYETAQSREPIMAIAPPYMFDADNDTSDAVTMELVHNESDYTLVVEADKSWINSIFRNFPVVIDPTIILDVNRNDIYDIHVNQDNPNTSYKLDYQLEVGKNGDNVFRTYIKYNLPSLPDYSIVTDAELTLVQNWARNFDTTDLYLNVYQCETDWNFDSITWNNQPIQNLSDATIVDYTNYRNGMSAEYNLNITKIVKDWYENGENYGLMLASSDETVEEKTSFYSSRNIAELVTDVKPAVTISYVNNTGIEDYWTYEGFSLGKSGSAYINTYNGALTYVHNDVNTSGLVSPLSISHIYTTDSRYNTGSINGMNLGKGFKLNIIERIEAVNSSLLENYPYKYIDGDGTVHFFKQDSGGCYYEFGSDIRLTSNSSGFVMSFMDGSLKEFSSSGYLTKLTDNNGNSITITYSNGLITKVTDGGGISVNLSYNHDNSLNYIADAAGRKTYFSYDNQKLTCITYPDGSSTFYEYGSNGLMSKIISYDNRQATLSYKKTEGIGTTFYKVSSFSTYDEEPSLYDTISLEYRTADTVVSSARTGDVVVLASDNLGRVTNQTLNNEETRNTSFNNSGNLNNTVSLSSKPFSFGKTNYKPIKLTDHWNGEWDIIKGDNTGYSVAGDSSERANYYNTSLKLQRNVLEGSVYAKTKRGSFLSAGNTYTVSMNVNIVDSLLSGEVYMSITAYDENSQELLTVKSESITTTNNQWKLLFATITVPENAEDVMISCGIFNGVGTVYLNAMHREKSSVLNQPNLVYNGNFSTFIHPFPDKWNGSYGSRCQYETDPETGNAYVYMIGIPGETRSILQEVYACGSAGDIIVFGASAKALCAATNGNGSRFFGIRLDFYDSSNAIVQSEAVEFDRRTYNTWQTVMSSVTAECNYSRIDFVFAYNNEINKALFDNAFLYRDSYGTSYDYDAKGRISSVSDDNGNNVDYSYTGADLTNVTVKANDMVTQSATYAYDANHNLLSSAGMDGVKTSYTFPSSGNKGLPLSVTVSDASDENTSTTSYTYYDNYNYLKSVTDASGATVQYEYDNGGAITKGLVTKITDPNGNITEYEYDPDTDLLISIANPAESVYAPEMLFEYDHAGRLIYICDAEIGFNLFYDSLGRLYGADTTNCSPFLINEYDDDGNIYKQFYGSTDHADFTYDEKDRLTSESYNDVLAYEYAYNDSGELGRITDHESGVSWHYQYDLAGRLTNISGDDNRNITYEYNNKNQLGRLKVSQVDSVMLETLYSYDAYGRTTAAQVTSMQGSPIQSYSYDSLGRTSAVTSSYAENSQITQNYSYVVNGTNQTGRIDSVSFSKTASGITQSLLPTVSYDYDAKGNITHIYENDVLKIKYYYDALNRLIREDNSEIDKTVVYNYNRFGNLISKVEYALTFGSLGEAVNTIPYEYRGAYSPDAITKYNGEESQIIYDTLGNPYRYRGYSMTWVKGRQLSAVSDADTSITFKYNNNGIRTKKTVNGVDTEFTYVGDMLVSQKTGNEIINFAYTAGGAPYGFTFNGTSYFYLLNLQGDIIGIYDSNGNVVVEYTYDSWGKLISITGSLADTIGIKNPLRYRGYYYDTETNLYYLQSRYYDPETCRFINMDAYFIAGDYFVGKDMYAYCLNNPIYYLDKTGYEPLPFWQILQMIGLVTSLIPIFENLIIVIQKYVPIDVTEKLNNEMRKNAAILSKYKDEHGYFEAVKFFVNQVRTGGEWDFKYREDWALDSNRRYLYDGKELKHDDIGNIHFGYVGRVLFSEEILCIGAGIYQLYDNDMGWSIDSYFDDPRDQEAIRFGSSLWDSGGV